MAHHCDHVRSIMLASGLALLSLGSEVASAHHSAAMFDDKKCETIAGTVRNFQWQYPHTWLWIIVPNGSADGDIWGFEMPPSGSLAGNPSWSRRVMQKGDKVSVYYSPLRDGRHGGLANAIVLPNSKVLHAAPNAFACEAQDWKQGPSGTPYDATPTIPK